MEITVSRAELLKELTMVQGVVERKTTIPILSNLLFEVTGDSLNLTATDLDLSLRTQCKAKVKKDGACTIPARKLFDYVKLLPDGELSLKLQENHWVQVKCGRSNTKMVGMARANFPAVPAFPEGMDLKLPSAILKKMIASTVFAISQEESRYTLNGALLVIKADSMTMVATDGHRLAHIENSAAKFQGVGGENKTLVPRKAMVELITLLNETEEPFVHFAKDDSTLFFKVGSRLLTSRQLTGQFPPYEAVLPRENNKSVTVDSGQLSAALQRVAQFSDVRSGAVRLKMEKDELRISASSQDSGESEDSIETKYSADPVTIGFNSIYLLDFLKASSTGNVMIEFKDSQSAGQMRPADAAEGYKYRYVVMPMRI